MTPLPRTYRFLAGLDDGAVDDALAAGVRELDGPYLRFAVEVLLQRGRADGLPAAIECYHRLPAELKDRVVAAEGAIAPLLRTTVRGEPLQMRLNSLEIASRIGSESLAYLFDMGLMDSQPKVRELAALTIRQMALRLLGEHPLLRIQVAGDSRRPAPAVAGSQAPADNNDTHHDKGYPRLRFGLGNSYDNDHGDGNDHGPATAQDHGTREQQGAGSRGQGPVAAVAPAQDHAGQPAEGPVIGAMDATGGAASPPRLAQRRHHLFEALLSGAHRYESHLRAEVVEACMWFEPYLGERFWGLLAQPRSKLPRLVAELLTGSDEPAAACLLMQALSVAELRPQAIKAVSERRDGQWFRAVLRGVETWHPWQRVRRGWNFIKDIAYLYTLDGAAWAELGDRAALPILIAASNPGLQKKALLMERLLGQAKGTACRRQILLEACRGRDWGTSILEAALREATDPAELRMAAYGLLGVAHEGLMAGLVKRIGEMGDAAPAGLVGLTADLVFWRLWTRFDTMQEERRVAALATIRGFAGHLKDRLRVNLASASTSHRLRAVRIAGLLGLVDALWQDMRLAARDPSPRVRSAAVRFLGGSNRPELRQSLLAALEDPDGRVQANALDAMDEAGWPDLAGLVVTKLDSEHIRVRANAARLLARAGHERARQVLTEMLEDSRAECRLAAIRAIQQVGPGTWRAKLAELAEKDSSSAVRRQAAACTGQAGARQPDAAEDKKDGQAEEEQGQGSGDGSTCGGAEAGAADLASDTHAVPPGEGPGEPAVSVPKASVASGAGKGRP